MSKFYFDEVPDLLKFDTSFLGVKVGNNGRLTLDREGDQLVPTVHVGLLDSFEPEFTIDYGEFKDELAISLFEDFLEGKHDSVKVKIQELASFDCPDPVVTTRRDELGVHVSDLEHALFKSRLIKGPVALINPSFGTMERASAHGYEFLPVVVRAPGVMTHVIEDDIQSFQMKYHTVRIPTEKYESYVEMHKDLPDHDKYFGFSFGKSWDDKSYGFQVNPYHETFIAGSLKSVEETDDVIRVEYLRNQRLDIREIDKFPLFYRYTWDVYSQLFAKHMWHGVNPYCGTFNFCSGLRMEFDIPITSTPNVIGAKIVDGYMCEDADGTKFLCDVKGNIVDICVPEDYGSRQRMIPFERRTIFDDGSAVTRFFVNVAQSGYSLLESNGKYDVTKGIPVSMFSGDYDDDVVTIVLRDDLQSHRLEVLADCLECGAQFVRLFRDELHFIGVDLQVYMKISDRYPMLRKIYDGEHELKMVVPRVPVTYDMSPYAKRVKSTNIGYELMGLRMSFLDMIEKFGESAFVMRARDVVNCSTTAPWTKKVVGVHVKTQTGFFFVRVTQNDFYHVIDRNSIELVTPGTTMYGFDMNFCVGFPTNHNGSRSISLIGCCTYVEPCTLQEAFKRLSNSGARCYRHALFEERLTETGVPSFKFEQGYDHYYGDEEFIVEDFG